MFLPQGSGAIDVCYSLMSTAADGSRYVTTTSTCPSAASTRGLVVDRRPCCRSLPACSRFTGAISSVVPGSCLLGRSDGRPERVAAGAGRVNTELGFLNPPGARETWQRSPTRPLPGLEGDWMLNYLAVGPLRLSGSGQLAAAAADVGCRDRRRIVLGRP